MTADYLPHVPALVAEFIRADGLASWIWVLLWGKDKPIGIMGISSRESREYTSNDENLLVAIGRQLLRRSKRSDSTKKPAELMKICAARRSSCCKAKKCQR